MDFNNKDIPVEVIVSGMQEAFSVLQRRVNMYNNEGYAKRWVLNIINASRRDNNNNNNNDEDDGEQNSFLWWDRFLTIVSRDSSETELDGIGFVTTLLDRPNDEVLERLFRDVLPTLAGFFYVYSCQILPAYMDMFLTSLIINNHDNNIYGNLRYLHFEGIALHPSSVAAIARLLSCAKFAKNGNGTPFQRLVLIDCDIDSTGCELILKTLDGNTCLRHLNLHGNEISEISLEAAKAVGNCKTLYSLELRGNPLSEQSLCHLAEGLRTNDSIVQLGIVNRRMSRIAMDAFAELLKTFNYSLQEVSCIEKLQGSEKLLLQNQRIRRLLGNLIEGNKNMGSSNTKTASTGSFHVPQLYLWPPALGCIGSKPSLIYRFIRHGNLESFTDQVLRSAELANVVGTGPWGLLERFVLHLLATKDIAVLALFAILIRFISEAVGVTTTASTSESETDLS